MDEHDLAVGVAVAVALLVGALEALGQLGRVRLGRPRHRQLEGLARVAQLVDDLGLGALIAGRQRLADQRLDLRGDPLSR